MSLGRRGLYLLRPGCHVEPVSDGDPMKIKIRLKLNAEMVSEARHLGLDLSRIVEEGLTQEIEAERRRRQIDLAGDREGGDPTE